MEREPLLVMPTGTRRCVCAQRDSARPPSRKRRWPRSRTPRWLTHELCKARPRRPSSWSWLLPRRARRRRVEMATSVAGPTRRCCTSSSSSTGRPSSSGPSHPAACLTSSSRSSRHTCAAASSSMASPTLLAGSVASRRLWGSLAKNADSARHARAGAWLTSRPTSSTRCSRRSPFVSGSARCRAGCATRWATIESCAPTCSTRSSPRCVARCAAGQRQSSACARSRTRASVRSPSSSAPTPRCG
ncbi:hypothetical protein ENSA5_26440 [Enhygromyxa salina]|uniref:Uncharacterized protein n=1 Tax=Enhygromyxa salina TaxID=215803 RepID=A0A2S9YAM0_9BACT|nr:hypothetical protein ENSA5_26440 [Enhygromyxa salina]